MVLTIFLAVQGHVTAQIITQRSEGDNIRVKNILDRIKNLPDNPSSEASVMSLRMQATSIGDPVAMKATEDKWLKIHSTVENSSGILPIFPVEDLCGAASSFDTNRNREESDREAMAAIDQGENPIFVRINRCVSNQQNIYQFIKEHWDSYRQDVKVYCTSEDQKNTYTPLLPDRVGYAGLLKCLNNGKSQSTQLRKFVP